MGYGGSNPPLPTIFVSAERLGGPRPGQSGVGGQSIGWVEDAGGRQGQVGHRDGRAACRRGERSGREGGPRRAEVVGGSGREGGSNSVVESQPSKLLVAGSSPVSRSKLDRNFKS